MNEYEQRLKVIGQIEIVLDRLVTLEDELLKLPVGSQFLGEAVADGIGNVSLQTGALVGQLTLYKEAAS